MSVINLGPRTAAGSKPDQLTILEQALGRVRGTNQADGTIVITFTDGNLNIHWSHATSTATVGQLLLGLHLAEREILARVTRE